MASTAARQPPSGAPDAPRTQAQRSESTTTALLDAARELFAHDGYAATSLDAVVARAGVSKGALYHHFAGKQELFRAVFDREQVRLAEALAVAYTAQPDPWDGLRAGCLAFLDAALEPELQRIVLVDSFSALGFAAVREAEAGLLAALREVLGRSIEAGRIAPRPVEPLAALLFGALCEAALTTARADDQAAAKRAVATEFERLLDGLSARRAG